MGVTMAGTHNILLLFDVTLVQLGVGAHSALHMVLSVSKN